MWGFRRENEAGLWLFLLLCLIEDNFPSLWQCYQRLQCLFSHFMGSEEYEEGHPFAGANYSRHGMFLEPATVCTFSWSGWILYYNSSGTTLRLTDSQYWKLEQKSMQSYKCIQKIFIQSLLFARHYSTLGDGNAMTSRIHMSLYLGSLRFSWGSRNQQNNYTNKCSFTNSDYS